MHVVTLIVIYGIIYLVCVVNFILQQLKLEEYQNNMNFLIVHIASVHQ